jgi:3-phosphoshikimate 1-carboxyvinyltransferase
MNVLITPGKLSGTVLIPPSKSESHRAIIAASLAKGKSVISNVSYSDDILATIGAMEKIGVKFIKNAQQLIVNGVGRVFFSDDNFIDCNESASTLRFALPLFSLSKQKVVFTGQPSLFRRPMAVYETMFKQMNLSFVQTDKNIIMSGSLAPGYYELPGNISSQFISGLLFALPLLKGDSVVKVTTVFESEEYVTMTVSMLKRFGINIIVEEGNIFRIKGNQVYTPANFTVEGDFTQLAVFAVAGFLSGDITVKNIKFDVTQADRRILEIGEKMGGIIETVDNGYIFRKSAMKGMTIDIGQCPDIGPILALLGSLSEGTTIIDNAARLKFKESNRLQSTYETLKTLGADIELTDSSLIIRGKPNLIGGTLESFSDHRIVMLGAIASSQCQKPVLLKNTESVNKSYPEFFLDFARVGGNFTVIEG